MATALRASSKSKGVLGAALAEGSCAAGTSMVYCPPSSMSKRASMGCSNPLVSWRMIFSTTTRLLGRVTARSEEHTSELQSQFHLVCRLLLEKKNINTDVQL